MPLADQKADVAKLFPRPSTASTGGGRASKSEVYLDAISRALRYAEIEVRQDLISTEAGQRSWAQRLADTILAAVSA